MLFVTMVTDVQSPRPDQVLLHAEDVFDHQEEQSRLHLQILRMMQSLEVFRNDNFKYKN